MMKAIFWRTGISWIGLLVGLMLSGVLYAQDGVISSGTSTTLGAFQQEQQALVQEWQTLVSQGATQQQITAWRQQNAARFQAQQQRAQALSLASALRPVPALPDNIPANVSGTLKDFMTTRARLLNARVQLHNQLLQALPSEATQAEVDAMQQQEEQILQQQNAGDLQLQGQQAQALAAQSASQPLRVPGPTVLPANATPRLRAFVAARDPLIRAWAQLWNQYLTADPATRQAAMQQWRQQNAGQIQQLAALAQDLSNSSTANQ